MSKLRRFHNQPVMRLIVSVPMVTVEEIDRIIKAPRPNRHPARGCRAEYVRMALLEKLAPNFKGALWKKLTCR
jgi:hypothetical protein